MILMFFLLLLHGTVFCSSFLEWINRKTESNEDKTIEYQIGQDVYKIENSELAVLLTAIKQNNENQVTQSITQNPALVHMQCHKIVVSDPIFLVRILWSPIDEAVCGNKASIVKILLEGGAYKDANLFSNMKGVADSIVQNLLRYGLTISKNSPLYKLNLNRMQTKLVDNEITFRNQLNIFDMQSFSKKISLLLKLLSRPAVFLKRITIEKCPTFIDEIEVSGKVYSVSDKDFLSLEEILSTDYKKIGIGSYAETIHFTAEKDRQFQHNLLHIIAAIYKGADICQQKDGMNLFHYLAYGDLSTFFTLLNISYNYYQQNIECFDSFVKALLALMEKKHFDTHDSTPLDILLRQHFHEGDSNPFLLQELQTKLHTVVKYLVAKSENTQEKQLILAELKKALRISQTIRELKESIYTRGEIVPYYDSKPYFLALLVRFSLKNFCLNNEIKPLNFETVNRSVNHESSYGHVTHEVKPMVSNF